MPPQWIYSRPHLGVLALRILAALTSLSGLIIAIIFSSKEKENNIFLYCAVSSSLPCQEWILNWNLGSLGYVPKWH